MVAGVDVRLKRIVATHFMGSSIDSDLLQSFINELIVKIENKVHCFIDALVFDLGPHNVAVVNKFGLTMQKGAKVNSIPHPSGDPSRVLFMIPDPTHGLKCIASKMSYINLPEELDISKVFKHELTADSPQIHFSAKQTISSTRLC